MHKNCSSEKHRGTKSCQNKTLRSHSGLLLMFLMLLACTLPASPSCCCPSSTGQAALCDGKRGTPHQEGRWRCHGYISHSQLAQPLELLLWDAGTSSLIQLRMEVKQAGKHEALKSSVNFPFCCHYAALNHGCGLENPKISSLFASHVSQAMLVSKITAFFPPAWGQSCLLY